MFYYICRDLTNALKYLPIGIVAGGLCYCMLSGWNAKRKRKRKESIPVVPRSLFFTYLAVILTITFLSREGGNQLGFDLEIFSTWGINNRNNALVIENILLFVPYGIVCPMAFLRVRKFGRCLAVGALTSLGVELLQLFTGRGFFQIDDILTNIIGTIIGYWIFSLARWIGEKVK